jgi:hypothetical protein
MVTMVTPVNSVTGDAHHRAGAQCRGRVEDIVDTVPGNTSAAI